MPVTCSLPSGARALHEYVTAVPVDYRYTGTHGKQQQATKEAEPKPTNQLLEPVGSAFCTAAPEEVVLLVSSCLRRRRFLRSASGCNIVASLYVVVLFASFIH